MDTAKIQQLWQQFQSGEITEQKFRQESGFTRETYLFPRQSEYRAGRISKVHDKLLDLKSSSRDDNVRFFGASADG